MKNNLPIIIFKDLLNNNKMLIILLFILYTSAFFVIFITYQTRLLNEKLEDYYIEYNILNLKKYNLILEENEVMDFNIIKEIAKKKINMKTLFNKK